MKELFKMNNIPEPVSAELPVFRNYYLRKIAVISDDGSCLPNIDILKERPKLSKEENEEESEDERNTLAQLNRFSSVLTDGSLTKEAKSKIINHMKKMKIFFYTYDSFNQDVDLKSKLSKMTKKKIREYFLKEQFHIDKVLAEEEMEEDFSQFEGQSNGNQENYVDDLIETNDLKSKDNENEDSEEIEGDTFNGSTIESDDDSIFNNPSTCSNPPSSTSISTKSSQIEKNNFTSPASRGTKRTNSTPSLSNSVSPAKKKGKKSLTPRNTVRGKKSDYAKVNVYTTIKVPSKTLKNEGKFLVVVTTENGSGDNLFAWRPTYLKPVFELFQDDYEEGEYLGDDIKFEVYEQVSEPQGEDQKISGSKYPVNLLTISMPYTKQTCHKAGLAFKDHKTTEKEFVKLMFDSFWDSMVKDSLFEPRLINCIERANCSEGDDFDETYPRRHFKSYNSRVAQCLAQDKTSKKKRSDNFDKLDKPEKVFHWDVPLSNLITKSNVHLIKNEFDCQYGPNKVDKEIFEKFTGFAKKTVGARK